MKYSNIIRRGAYALAALLLVGVFTFQTFAAESDAPAKRGSPDDGHYAHSRSIDEISR